MRVALSADYLRLPPGARARHAATRRGAVSLPLAGALLVALLWGVAQPRADQNAQAQAATLVHYRAGWNLVAAPTGTLFDQAQGPAYTLDPDTGENRPLGPGEVVGGRGIWLYFAHDVSATLGKSAAEFSRAFVPPGKQVLLGNPSADQALTVSGADSAIAYDPDQGYHPVQDLAPGQGAFVRVAAGGEVTLGKPAPGSPDTDLRRLQGALLAAPTDRALVEQLGGLAAEAVRARRYGQVQTMIDDLRTTQEDGLRRQGSGPLPPLSAVQRDSARQVREAVARAKSAADAGDIAAADAAIGEARRVAQAAEDDGLTLARGGDDAAPANATTAARSWSGRMAPREDVWTLVPALISGQIQLPDAPPPSGPPAGVPPPPPPPAAQAAGGACDVAPGALSLDPEERDAFDRANAYRVANGLAPLQLSTSLQRSAAWKTKDMVARRAYDHDDGFRSWDQRFKDCGYDPSGDFFIAENLATGNPTGAETFDNWRKSSVHNQWLLDPDFHVAGIKRSPAPGLPPGDAYSWVWVMEFGTVPGGPLDASAGQQ